MLVLSRKADQEVMIGDDIQLTILKVKGNTVRIGIKAPDDIRIIRGELRETVEQFEVPRGNRPLTVKLSRTGGKPGVRVFGDESSSDRSTAPENQGPNAIERILGIAQPIDDITIS